MPFTLAHIALVLPLRRRLPLDALALGSMAPDFEYLGYLAPAGGLGHGFPWVLTATLPAALIAVGLWRHQLLPRLRGRLGQSVGPGPSMVDGRTLVAVMGGIASHLAWDAFTHRSSDGLARLNEACLQGLPIYKVLQYTSSLAGMAALLVVVRSWARRRPELVHQPRFRAMVLFTLMTALGMGVVSASRVGSFRHRAAHFATGWLAGLGGGLVACALFPVMKNPAHGAGWERKARRA